ncbi:fatty acid desaturase [uncultured Abyssibacter sp.]|uniref:fatty acid desaturase n=1 Tax=uncultured Abyssibacter sp. TaxID=2320202 RepID=UPI0032B112F0
MTSLTTKPADSATRSERESLRPSIIPFIGLHIACLGILWTGFTVESVVLCAILYVIRVFGITAGYHRLLAHRSFKAGRVTQFLIVLAGSMSLQRGPLWWAAKHREHHRDSDTPADAHSPRHYGFWGAHMGWIFRPRHKADMNLIRDFAQYPELRWLEKNQYLPGMALGLGCYLLGGWDALFVGFCLSTVLVYHVTFMINSLAHVFGRQRFLTGDDSRNNAVLAVLAMGEGWHNNHHYYPSTARAGFRWYEIDMTYYVLWVLSKFGLVWDLRQPPQSVLRGTKAPTARIIDQTAGHLASAFCVDELSQRIRTAWADSHHMDEVKARARQARDSVEAYLADIELPHLPTLDQLRTLARRKFANVPALEDVVQRAHARLVTAVSERLASDLAPQTA